MSKQSNAMRRRTFLQGTAAGALAGAGADTMGAGAVPKVGRNAPCPCGSGKKFKQCHGRVS